MFYRSHETLLALKDAMVLNEQDRLLNLEDKTW